MPLKQQRDTGGSSISTAQDYTFRLTQDYYLLLLVLGALGIFYMVIMYIVGDARADRINRLNKLK